ncbi:MAG: UDP-N-acetylmuramate--L-alanine ligase [Crocinitomicaceae bacterium]|jgi:UDP-N-acetylmuramate--alanine ligase|nr:UDP-N-acetylmuramate--L-alanine ligase [Crocinitomicaceae bacterium]
MMFMYTQQHPTHHNHHPSFLKMKDLNTYKNIYFLGIGGIGMSALARYFNERKFTVGGYDKTPSPLTDELEKEGIAIHFEDLGSNLPVDFKNAEDTLVIYTPAIPKSLGELNFIRENGFTLLKRAQVLGLITQNSRGLGVAGTHGKTTTSTMLTHILNESHLKCSAFLGGISANFASNFVSSTTSDLTVIEADEFDRSFLQLHPYASIITSTDADHLDIYGDASLFLEGFQLYAQQIDENGLIVMRKGLQLTSKTRITTYAINEEADYSGSNLVINNGRFYMDVQTPQGAWKNMELGLPGIHNAENALACIALCTFLGLSEEEIRHGLQSFKGVKRRFEYQLRTENLVYIDDYAHHPTEIKALVDSVRLIYPGKKITGIFQPHLFSRTRDFQEGFINELSRLDELILLPIYPAREEPIPGVTSDMLLEKCTNKEKQLLSPDAVVERVTKYTDGVILTIGAGDIDRIVPKIKTGLIGL